MNESAQATFESVQPRFPALTLEMAQAVIEAYEAAYQPFYLTQHEKSEIASKITVRSGSSKDAVEDVFYEVARRFIVRRRGPATESKGQE